jgi:radical SAM protein with 4Fe4S-binding SPASM domain
MQSLIGDENMYRELYLFLTNQCPNRCQYCYIKYNNNCLSEQDIDEAILKYNPDRIVFFGGEPLLRLDLMEYTMKKYHDDIKFQVITSTMANWKEFINLKKKYRIELQISWDGFKDSRVDTNGNSIADRVLEHINYAIAEGMKFDIKTVVNTANVKDIPKMNKLFQRLDKEFHVNGQYCIARGEYHDDQWFKDLEENLYCTFEGTTIHPYTENLNKIMAYINRAPMQSCSAGRDNELCYLTDKTISYCTSIAFTNQRYEDPDKIQQRCKHKDCQIENCKYYYLCDGGCRYERMKEFGDKWLENYLPETCKLMKVYNNLITKYLSSLDTNQTNELYKTLLNYKKYLYSFYKLEGIL